MSGSLIDTLRGSLILVSGWSLSPSSLRVDEPELVEALRFELDPLGPEFERADWLEFLGEKISALPEPRRAIGVSLGGALLLKLVIDQPGLFSSVTLCSTAAAFVQREDYLSGQPPRVYLELKAKLTKDLPTTLREFYRGCFFPSRLSEAELDQLVAHGVEYGLAKLIWGLDCLADLDLRSALKRVLEAQHLPPIKLSHGAKDLIVPRQAALGLLAALPSATLEQFPEEGHLSYRFIKRYSADLNSADLNSTDLNSTDSTGDAEARERQAIARRFSRAARSYDESATVQRQVAEGVASRTRDIKGSVFEVGCGTGLLTKLILREPALTRLTAIDISAEMVELTAGLASDPQSPVKMELLRGDLLEVLAEHPELENSFEHVVSASALQWIRPLSLALEQIRRLLVTGGRFSGALMIEGTLDELHQARARVAPAKTPDLRLPTNSEVLLALRGVGLELLQSEEASITFEASSAQEILRMLHLLGTTRIYRNILTRGELAQLCAEYERGSNGRAVRATYKVLYLEATRPA